MTCFPQEMLRMQHADVYGKHIAGGHQIIKKNKETCCHRQAFEGDTEFFKYNVKEGTHTLCRRHGYRHNYTSTTRDRISAMPKLVP